MQTLREYKSAKFDCGCILDAQYKGSVNAIEQEDGTFIIVCDKHSKEYSGDNEEKTDSTV